jgi:hypothetical protein
LAPILSIAEDQTAQGIGVAHRHDRPLWFFEYRLTPGGVPGMAFRTQHFPHRMIVQVVDHG